MSRAQVHSDGRLALNPREAALLHRRGIKDIETAYGILVIDSQWNPETGQLPKLRNTRELYTCVAFASQETSRETRISLAYHYALMHPHADKELIGHAMRYVRISRGGFGIRYGVYRNHEEVIVSALQSPHLTPAMFARHMSNMPLQDTEPTAYVTRTILNHPHVRRSTVKRWVQEITTSPSLYAPLTPALLDPAWVHAPLLTPADRGRLLVVTATHG